MTSEEFFDWVHRPENRGRWFELERGKVIEMPPPGMRHGVVCGNVGWILNGFVRQRNQGYVCTNDTGVILETDPDTVRGIDVVLYDKSVPYDNLTPKYATSLPQLAVEVLSPDDRPGRMTRRVTQFLQKGIPLVWIVDAEDRDITVYRSGHEPYVLGEKDEITGEDVLPDLRCRVADFFCLPGEALHAAEAEATWRAQSASSSDSGGQGEPS
ncbi:MAG TPA: Uma2 family endonuclease [Candidatus Anammoximicrobium sp.]|nr:Uma2 family endonuclease [Candidatus Anammoximicrobium sp.]